MPDPTELHTLNDIARDISRIADMPDVSLEAARDQIAALIARLLPGGEVRLEEAAEGNTLPEGSNSYHFPLTHENLRVVLPAGHNLRPQQQAMLENIAIHAAAALDRVRQAQRLQRSLQRKEDELARLRRADMLISSRLRLEETLEAILEMALEVTGARYGIFRLLDESGTHLITRAVAGEDMGQPHTEALPMDENSITGRAAIARKTLCIADVQAPPWRHVYYPLDHALKMRSELVTPLIGASGRLEGILNLESPHVGAFSDDDALLLQSLATQAVIAIQEVRLLDALQELSARLLAEHPEALYRRVVQLARELLGAPGAALWLGQNGDLQLQAVSPEATTTYDVAWLTPLLGSVMSADHPRIVRPGYSATRQGLAAPLLAGELEPSTGVLAIFAEAAPLPASDWDKKVLVLLARHAALAAINARRQALLRRLSPREREVFDLMVAGLSNKAIAQTLVISPNTVKRHLRAIFDKLDVNSRAAAVAKVFSSYQNEGS